MKCVIRKGIFETNSSSDSALLFSDSYPEYIESEFSTIYEITNDGYRKLCYALAFILGDNITTATSAKAISLKKSFFDYYAARYCKEITPEFEKQLEKDIAEIRSDYYSSISIGDTCLQPLLDKFWCIAHAADDRLKDLPSDEELARILTTYFSDDSYVVYAQDEL